MVILSDSQIPSEAILKMLPRVADVDEDGFRRNLTIRQYYHHVCVSSEHINKGRKVGISNLHTLKMCCKFGTAKFELFNYVRYFLKSVDISVLMSLCMRNYKKGGFLEQKDLIGI